PLSLHDTLPIWPQLLADSGIERRCLGVLVVHVEAVLHPVHELQLVGHSERAGSDDGTTGGLCVIVEMLPGEQALVDRLSRARRKASSMPGCSTPSWPGVTSSWRSRRRSWRRGDAPSCSVPPACRRTL